MTGDGEGPGRRSRLQLRPWPDPDRVDAVAAASALARHGVDPGEAARTVARMSADGEATLDMPDAGAPVALLADLMAAGVYGRGAIAVEDLGADFAERLRRGR